MNVFLLDKSANYNFNNKPLWNSQDILSDLNLNPLVSAMCKGDKFKGNVITSVLVESQFNHKTEINYRQAILKDCLANELDIEALYGVCLEAVKSKENNLLGIFTTHPSSVLYCSLSTLKCLCNLYRKIRLMADQISNRYQSAGFHRFWSMIQNELTDEYFSQVACQIKNLDFRNGIDSSISQHNESFDQMNYSICKPDGSAKFKIKDILKYFTHNKSDYFSFEINSRDESSIRALTEITDRSLNEIAQVVAQTVDQMFLFFKTLRFELAFYIGCTNLYKLLNEKKMPFCFPDIEGDSANRYALTNLYDICLALDLGRPTVANDLRVREKNLIIITGANKGGKTTFLRSIGIAQLMMQSGMFVPADTAKMDIAKGIYTHFKRQEDHSLESGKLDEELARMSLIADHLEPGALLLFNESFAATNDREGSEIAMQIIQALQVSGMISFFVTHLYELPENKLRESDAETLFLRAERLYNGKRTYKIIEAAPLSSSFGHDLYKKIFLQ